MDCVPRQLCAGAAQLAACEAADADADSDADSDGDDSTLYACTLASAARSRLRFWSLCTCVAAGPARRGCRLTPAPPHDRLWFDTEEEFFAAASKCAALYFLPERRIYFDNVSLTPPDGDPANCVLSATGTGRGAMYRILQRGSPQDVVLDNTGGAVYDAAIALSRYLATTEAGNMRGKTVLELGCGPGLVTMVAARLVGATGYVCATDGDACTVDLAAENLKLMPESNAAAARFWWGTDPDDVPAMQARSWDYVVASDVAYEPAVFGPLCQALAAVSTRASRILLCNCVRSSRRERALKALLQEHFSIETVDVSDLAYSQEEEAGGEEEGGTRGAEGAPAPADTADTLQRRRFHRYTLLWVLERR